MQSGWLEKAKWRQENSEWLDMSFSISVKILSTLKENKKNSIYPINRDELSDSIGCSKNEMLKMLNGKENFNIETICKIQRILKINLVELC